MSADTTPGPVGADSAEPPAPEVRLPRDAAYWARPVSHLVAETHAAKARRLDGKELIGPEQGFGALWRRRHRLRLTGTDHTPAQVVGEWREHFGEMWPRGMGFHPTTAGISPGELAGLDMGLGQMTVLSTGVFVLYSDETSFTYMTPQGHAFAAWITFSAEEDDDGTTVAQVDMLLRPADPLIDLTYVVGAGRIEDRFWRQTLVRLGEHLGADPGRPTTTVECLDHHRKWRNWTNLRHFGGLRTVAHGFRAPRAR